MQDQKSLIAETLRKKLFEYRADWNFYASEVLGVKLDKNQKKVLEDIQHNKRVSVRSGISAGKDYVSAVAGVCFLNLFKPSKVVLTAPTARQILSIMMPEVNKIYANVKDRRFIGGIPLTNKVKFEKSADRFLMGFKSQPNNTEVWSGIHSPNLMVIATEASGIEDIIFDSIEGILVGGNEKLVIIFNPNRTSGFAYRSTFDKKFIRHQLSALDADNVKQKKLVIPGQVNYEWVEDKIDRWCAPIEKIVDEGDFEWEGKFYRANDLFRVKALGLFPAEDESSLYRLGWIHASNNKWSDLQDDNETLSEILKRPLLLGVDVAGQGNNETVFCHRYGNYVHKFESYGQSDTMQVVKQIKDRLKKETDTAYIDTIGEGAGVYSRCKELIESREMVGNVISAKASNSADGLRDFSGQRKFLNMRAYGYWAIRDQLNPDNYIDSDKDDMLILPKNEKLEEELIETQKRDRSDDKILIIEKDKIKEVIKRSPDTAESLHLTFYKPKRRDLTALWSVGER